MGKISRRWAGSLLLGALMLVTMSGIARAVPFDPAGPSSGDGVTPRFVLGNATCAALNADNANFPGVISDFGAKTKGGNASQYDGQTLTLTDPPLELTGSAPSDLNHWVKVFDFTNVNTAPGQTFSWLSNIAIDAVIVKGGDNVDAYAYVPGDTGDTLLHAPVNPDNNLYFAISHIEFCYHYALTVSKTATPTFTRTWNWTIDKSVTPDTLNKYSGESGTVQYTVAVDKTGSTDSAWAVSGSISIFNDTPLAATITGVSDVISGPNAPAVTPSCPVSFPSALAPGATLTCTYSSSLPDGTSRTNTGTATTTGNVAGGSGTASITFTTPTTVVNDTINVTDSYAGAGPWQFSDDGSQTYQRTFTCDADRGTITNTATITETGQSDSASVTVNCAVRSNGNGCTLTQGYWKNHTAAIVQWLPITLGPGGGYSIVVTTAPQAVKILDFDNQGWYSGKSDNGLNKLLGQLLAAKLNIAAGANPSAIASAITAADAFLAANNNWSALTKTQQAPVLAWKDTFDKFNQGNIGPGKCTG